jgi:hypothetical protein
MLGVSPSVPTSTTMVEDCDHAAPTRAPEIPDVTAV